MHSELQDSAFTFGTFHTCNLSETTLHRQDTSLSKKHLGIKVSTLNNFCILHHQFIVCLSFDSNLQGVQDQGQKIELSGPPLQAQKVDEFLDRHEQCIQKAIRKSWFQRGKNKKNSIVCLSMAIMMLLKM